MYKFILSILVCLFLTPCVFAKDIIKMKLGDFDFYGIKVTDTQHRKDLFKYKDETKLKELLNKSNSNSSAINLFLLDTGDSKILFDTGIDAKVLLERLNQLNISPKEINMICLTHMHYDHIAGLINDFKRTFPKTDIYIAQEEIDANKNSDIFVAYSNRIKPFKQNEQITSFIKSVPSFGHTLGHTMFEITSKGNTIVVWGDILHAPIQFEDPNIYLTYDTDPIQALSTRKQVMQEYSDSNKYIAGAHLLNCGIGKLQKENEGYKFIFLEEQK